MLKDRQELRNVTTAILPEYVYLVSYFIILENNEKTFGDVLVQSSRELLTINQDCDLYREIRNRMGANIKHISTISINRVHGESLAKNEVMR